VRGKRRFAAPVRFRSLDCNRCQRNKTNPASVVLYFCGNFRFPWERRLPRSQNLHPRPARPAGATPSVLRNESDR
jgi:hypothetical protein